MRMMFSQPEKKIVSSEFELALRAGEGDFCSMSLPGTLSLSMGGLECNTFGEDGCLIDKFKVHSQIDNFGAEAEIFQTIPFGTEFKVQRRFDCASNFMRMTLDIDPGRGAIEELKLEDIVFEGELANVKIFSINDGKIELTQSGLDAETKVFYTSQFPPVAVQITDSTGAIAEFGCGNDLWRHRTVELYSNCQAEFKVSGNNGKIVFSRLPLKFAGEDAMPRRSFRFKYYIAFAEKTEKISSAEKVFAVDSCMSSPAVRRNLRDFLRKFSGASLKIEAENFLCSDAGHLERPTRDELLHWSVEDFFEVMLWGSKLFAAKGAKLFFGVQKNAAVRELCAMKVCENLLKNDLITEE